MRQHLVGRHWTSFVFNLVEELGHMTSLDRHEVSTRPSWQDVNLKAAADRRLCAKALSAHMTFQPLLDDSLDTFRASPLVS
jgi:hypothetical protein